MTTCRVRPGKPEDLPYLTECWLQTAHAVTGQRIGWMKNIVRSYLRACEVRVAAVVDDPDAILGFAVVDPSTGHTLFAYTRLSARRLGIQNALFRKDPS